MSSPSPAQPVRSLPWTPIAIIVLGLGAIAAGVGIWLTAPWQTGDIPDEPTVGSRVDPNATEPIDRSAPDESKPETVDGPESETTEPEVVPEDILGHYPYDVADAGALTAITRDGRIRLRPEAARQFLAMQEAARARGISLVALSGYRTFDEQKYLFFQIKQNRGQDARERAKVSAPPGYSEHHTGYAIDIGDGNASDTHIQESFEATVGFAWLEANAARYGFELSFPRDNEQGISYEPWHWRYVGNPDSLETFYKGR
ncbi:MAG: M15 family metallopeptidase [Cyanobacteria bacterium J06641_5]